LKERIMADGIPANHGENGKPSGRSAEEIEAELMNIDAINAELGDDDDLEPPAAAASGNNAPDMRAEVDKASRKGWVPKEKWVASGKPAEQWVDAQTFNKRGDAFVGNLQAELDAVRKELDSFKGTTKAFVEFQKRMLAEKDAELQVALKQLRLQHKEAIRNGEDEEALELEDKIEAMRNNATAVKQEVVTDPNATPPENPILDEWIEDGNGWFKTDERMRKQAIAIGDQMRAAGETRTGRKFLDAVAEAMKDNFPRYFREKAGTPPSDRVNGGGGGSRNAGSGGRTARDLPAADRALMRDFIKQGLYTEESFLSSYFSRD
jgi:hypothetical protein